MIIPLYIIIYTAVLLVLALVTPLFSPFFRKVMVEEGVADEGEDKATLPPVSIVITDHDSAFHLQQVLPPLLEQQYAGDFQIVVVIDRSDSESEDVLKRLSPNEHLYYTMLPDTSRYLSRKKLGITLGMRAAKYEWVIVTDVHSMPSNPHWLTAMARHLDDNNNMVLGLTLYGDEAPAYFRYQQLRTALYHLRTAQRGTPFSTNQSVVMMRKSEFFNANGFRGNLEYARAEFEFLVNKYAKKGACAVAIEPEAWMTAICPSKKRWAARYMFAIDALRDMRRSLSFRLLFHTDLSLTHLYNLLTLVAIIVGALMLPQMNGIVLLAAAVALWLISFIERFIIYRPVLRYYHCVNPLTAIVMDWIMPLRNFILRMRYIFADKNDFITHKL